MEPQKPPLADVPSSPASAEPALPTSRASRAGRKPSPPSIDPSPIYLSGYGMELDADRDHFVIARHGERPAKIPALRVSEIVASRGSRVTQEAMATALRRKIPVLLLDRGGSLLGRLQPAVTGDARPRLCQFAAFQDETIRLSLARKIIRAKIGNSAAVLRRHCANHPGSVASSAMADLGRLSAVVDESPRLESLRGHEGTAARIYFGAFDAMLKHHSFTGRNRRPPADPPNALLSYTYTILAGELAAALEERGLDPYVGFFHELKPGRAALALDLLEPWRPWVADRFVIQSLNSAHLRPEHFDTEPRAHGITAHFLNQEGKRAYFRRLEIWLREAAGEMSGQGSLAVREARDFLDHLLRSDLSSWTPHLFLGK